VDDAPAASEDETFLGWQTGEGELLQPGDTYTVGKQPPAFSAVTYPNEPVGIRIAGASGGDPVDADTYVGFPLALDGLTLAVGAHQTKVEGTTSGAVTVLKWDGRSWAAEATMTVQDMDITPNANGFGRALDLGGDRLAVNFTAGTAGRVGIFERKDNTWTHVQTLASPRDASSALFGASMALSGDRLAVVEPAMSNPTLDSVVHVFKYAGATWSLDQTLTVAEPAKDRIVLDVDLDGDLLAMATVARDGSAGQVEIYEFTDNAWNAAAAILGNFLQSGRYGHPLSLDGNRLAFARYGEQCVNVYERQAPDTWITWPDVSTDATAGCTPGTATDGFGYAVALAGDRFVASAPWAGTSPGSGGRLPGSVSMYRFEDGDWAQRGATPSTIDGQIGETLAMNQHLVAVGRGVAGSSNTLVAYVMPHTALLD
jgi:hypothetical protein